MVNMTNFHSLVGVSRGSDPHLQVSGNLNPINI